VELDRYMSYGQTPRPSDTVLLGCPLCPNLAVVINTAANRVKRVLAVVEIFAVTSDGISTMSQL